MPPTSAPATPTRANASHTTDPAPPRLDPGALAGLVLAVLVSPVGLVLSFLARGKNLRGASMTVARLGVVLGSLGTVVWLALLAGLVDIGAPFAAITDASPMAGKGLTALITVVLGILGALGIYWWLNELSELLPGQWEYRFKPYFFILPAYVAISVYLLYPAVVTVINSFKDRFSEGWVGLKNYQELLTDPNFLDTLFNTLLWVVIVPSVTIVVGLTVAVLADRLKERGEKFVKTMIFLPMAISMVGAATVWRFVYSSQPAGTAQTGLFNAIWTSFGNDPVPWLQTSDWRLNTGLLMVILLWSQVGYAMVLLSAAVKGVPTETLEAARIDGASERQVFFKVVVPQIKGTMITVGVTVTIMVMKIFDIVYVNTNGGFKTNVIANEFINQLYTNFNYGSASSIVVLLMIAVIPIMIYQVRHFKAEEAA